MLVAAALLGGLLWSGVSVMRTARENLAASQARRMSVPLMLFGLAFALALLWILV